MAPILIDKRDLLKLGFLSTLVTVTVFSGGVLFGFERATTIHQAGNDVKVLTLPEKVVEAVALEPQHPETMAEGATIDVDSAETVAEVVNKKSISLIDESTVRKTKNVTVEDTSKAIASNMTNKHKAKAVVAPPLKSSATTDAIKNKNKQVIVGTVDDTVITSQKKKAVLFSSLTEDQVNNTNYSIQVGMYGRLLNAKNMVKMLHAKNLDAYVSDYTNRKGETRYNVRVGYFADKKMAVSALRDYRNTEKSDGYLVKFAAKNIVNLADAGNVKLPKVKDETEIAVMPTSNPGLSSAEVTFDKVSQADILSNSQNTENITTN